MKLNRTEIARRVDEARRIVAEGRLSKAPPSPKQLARLAAIKKSRPAGKRKPGKRVA